ncbi:MAG: multiphosphoryl transfer protein [Frankiaceae bacterium]|nr:multiphosphoryl transfer protein [Frankiaceae bacterium]
MTADQAAPADVHVREAVRQGRRAADRLDAVRQCGGVLVEIGAVEAPYVEAMVEREGSISTYVGEGIAIPHGTDESRRFVRRTALAVLTFPDGVDWGGGRVFGCVAIAASGSEHVALLASLADVLMDSAQAERLRTATDVDDVLTLLTPHAEENDS